MKPTGVIEIPKAWLTVLNNLCDIERKLGMHGDPGNALRNVQRIKETCAEQGLFYEDPTGQAFSETRTDLDATISGSDTDNLRVVEVIKPIIRAGDQSYSRVVQRGIVVVQAQKEQA